MNKCLESATQQWSADETRIKAMIRRGIWNVSTLGHSWPSRLLFWGDMLVFRGVPCSVLLVVEDAAVCSNLVK